MFLVKSVLLLYWEFLLPPIVKSGRPPLESAPWSGRAVSPRDGGKRKGRRIFKDQAQNFETSRRL